MRLKDKIAIVVGAGQSPGEGMGNGRATVLRFAQEGAKVLAVDNQLASAEETVAIPAGLRRFAAGLPGIGISNASTGGSRHDANARGSRAGQS